LPAEGTVVQQELAEPGEVVTGKEKESGPDRVAGAVRSPEPVIARDPDLLEELALHEGLELRADCDLDHPVQNGQAGLFVPEIDPRLVVERVRHELPHRVRRGQVEFTREIHVHTTGVGEKLFDGDRAVGGVTEAGSEVLPDRVVDLKLPQRHGPPDRQARNKLGATPEMTGNLPRDWIEDAGINQTVVPEDLDRLRSVHGQQVDGPTDRLGVEAD
jgi:hypothetical protein